MKHVRDHVKARLERVGVEALRTPSVAERFVSEALALAAEAGDTVRETEKARDRVISLLRAIERAYDLRLGLAVKYTPPPPKSPLRRSNWAVAAHRACAIYRQLEDRLRSRRHKGEALAALIVLSAIMRGGLLRSEAWMSLWAGLSYGKPEIKRHKLLGKHVWIDLKINQHTEVRFYPDVVTLGLLARWSPVSLPRLPSPDRLLRRIQEVLVLPEFPKADAFAEAAFAPLEDQYAAGIPSVLFEAARGSFRAGSVPSEHWEGSLCGEVLDVPAALRRRKPVKSAEAALSLEESNRELRQILTTRRKGAHKITRAPVRAGLEELIAQAPPPIVRARALWCSSLLKKGCKVSTLQRYESAVGKTLSLAFGEADPARMSVEEIEARLYAVLEIPGALQDKMTGTCLCQFFRFTFYDPRLYWPEPDLRFPQMSRKGPPRRAVITGPQIRQALKGLKDEGPHRVAFLLAARGGLRLSDMEALRICDVDYSRKGVVRLHPTTEGDIKTGAGRRQVPVAQFLRPQELSSWERFVAHRRQTSSNHRVAFLSEDRSLLEAPRFDRIGFARLLGEQLGLRPHDLRHGALSNIALALLAPEADKVVCNLTGWNADCIRWMREEYSGRDPLNGTHQIARLAGHRQAETTFDTYIHLTDLALGLHIAAVRDERPAAEAASMTGLNRRSVGRKRSVVLEDLRLKVLKKLPVTEIKPGSQAVPVTPEPQDKTPKVTNIAPNFVVILSLAVKSGLNSLEIAEKYAVPLRAVNLLMECEARAPLGAIPRRKTDRHWVVRQADKAMGLEDPRGFVSEIRAMPHRKLTYSAPWPAKRWLSGMGRGVRTEATLYLASKDNPELWKGIKAERVSGPRTRLELVPMTPAGTNAMPFLRLVADIVERTLKLREIVVEVERDVRRLNLNNSGALRAFL